MSAIKKVANKVFGFEENKAKNNILKNMTFEKITIVIINIWEDVNEKANGRKEINQ